MRVLVCGSRDWADGQVIDVVLQGYAANQGKDIIVIHGAARGADELAGDIAQANGFVVESYPASGDRPPGGWRAGAGGPGAGPVERAGCVEEGGTVATEVRTMSTHDHENMAMRENLISEFVSEVAACAREHHGFELTDDERSQARGAWVVGRDFVGTWRRPHPEDIADRIAAWRAVERMYATRAMYPPRSER